MKYFFIVVFFILILRILILPKYRLKKIYKSILNLGHQEDFEVNLVKNLPYHFTITKDNQIFLIYCLAVPSNSSVTINSPRTWKLFWGGSKSKPGRAYPNERYISEINPFLRLKVNDDKTKKIVIMYKSTEKVLMYLNESELKLISTTESAHGIRIINYINLENDLVKLLT